MVITYEHKGITFESEEANIFVPYVAITRLVYIHSDKTLKIFTANSHPQFINDVEEDTYKILVEKCCE